MYYEKDDFSSGIVAYRHRVGLGDGREKPITIDNLPKAAQEFLATYFKDLTVAYAVEESKYFGSEYEVTYTDRTEVEFRADGQWSAVDRKYSAVPAGDRSPADRGFRSEDELPRSVYPQDRP